MDKDIIKKIEEYGLTKQANEVLINLVLAYTIIAELKKLKGEK